METLLGTEGVNYGQAARFLLEAADVGVFRDQTEAFDYALERNWVPKNAQAASPASLEGLSLLVMKSFRLKGGVLYSVFKNPHYSYRELVYQKLIPGKSDPEQAVSGELFLQITGQVLALVEQEERVEETPQMEVPPLEERVEEVPQVEVPPLEERVEEVPSEPQEAEPERQRVAEEISAQLVARQVQDVHVEVGDDGVIVISNDAFEPNFARLEASEQRKMREIAEILKALPARKILVAGHSALAGTEEAQMQTSILRAQAVAGYLVQLGTLELSDITIRGYGAQRPEADNATAEGRALNRRVEITILE